MINDEVERLNNMQHSTFQEKMYRLQAQLNHNQNLLTEKFLETKNKNIYSSKNPMVDSILRNNYRTYQNSGFSQEENNILLNLTKDEQANS